MAGDVTPSLWPPVNRRRIVVEVRYVGPPPRVDGAHGGGIGALEYSESRRVIGRDVMD